MQRNYSIPIYADVDAKLTKSASIQKVSCSTGYAEGRVGKLFMDTNAPVHNVTSI